MARVLVAAAALVANADALRAPVRMSAAAPYTLYDLPVSNNGARVRQLLYYKGVGPEDVAIVSPMDLGGLRSDEYLAVNPQGKMPALACRDEAATFGESDTIARFLGGKFNDRDGPGDFAPSAGTPLAFKSDRLARHHDIYLAPIQGCLYKASPKGQAYGLFPTRAAALAEFQKQLGLIEPMVDEAGPYLCGAAPTQADCALFPTMIFAAKMLPLFDLEPAFGPKTAAWYAHLTSGADAVAAKVYEEVAGSLDGWEGKGRWSTIYGAGLRDAPEPTIFDKIVAGDIPSKKVYEDDLCYAFEDANPAAPVHVLLVPKRKDLLTQLRFASDEQAGGPCGLARLTFDCDHFRHRVLLDRVRLR
mmetsp:Transcript_3116/g.9482  ORF Transcript_3116/g.9482 Transcript_3116/m.9482 type:complete len:360 (-) Transcript_3116:115-1194(-)